MNCSEYFPLFLATLWVAGIFFHEGLDVGQGLVHWNPRDPCPSALTPPCSTLPQVRRPYAAWSTYSRASATLRGTRARRSKGKN